MEKRTPEQFLAEEGMTIDTARRIYSNILGFLDKYRHERYVATVSTVMLVKEFIIKETNRADDTSAKQFLRDIGENKDYIFFLT